MFSRKSLSNITRLFYFKLEVNTIHFDAHFDSDMKNLIGEASCRICQESFSTTVTGLFLWAVLVLFYSVKRTFFHG